MGRVTDRRIVLRLHAGGTDVRGTDLGGTDVRDASADGRGAGPYGNNASADGRGVGAPAALDRHEPDQHGSDPHGSDQHGSDPHGSDPHGSDPHGSDPRGVDAAVRAAQSIDTAPIAVRHMDTLAGEEPLEIRVGRAGEPHRALAVTMRTPGNDIDLAVGFLFTEGLIGSADDVFTAQLCAGTDEPNTYNVVDVTLAPHVPLPQPDIERNFYTTSSCGVCGKASIDAVRTRSRFDVAADTVTVAGRTLADLPPRLRVAQKAFDRTGGLHAAGIFTSGGDLLCVREDVGRHNAVDKLVGWAVRSGRAPLSGHILLVSGRASFELVQKAAMAGIPVLAAVSAPSTLAVDLAAEAGVTLVGFLRGATMNVYAGAQRIAVAVPGH